MALPDLGEKVAMVSQSTMFTHEFKIKLFTCSANIQTCLFSILFVEQQRKGSLIWLIW